MSPIVSYGVSSVPVSAAIARWISIRSTTANAAHRCLITALVSLGLSLALGLPTTRAVTTRIEPFPHATQFAASALSMVAAYALIVTLMFSLGTVNRAALRAVIHAVLLAACITAMAILLRCCGAVGDVDLDPARPGSSLLLGYHVIHFAYLAAILTRFVWLIRGYVRSRTTVLLRLGVRLDMLAAVAGLLWICWNTGALVAVRAGGRPWASLSEVPDVLAGLAAVLLAVGTTAPTVIAWIVGIHRYRDLRRTLNRLTPLWTELTDLLPQVRFPVACERDDGVEAALDYQLYRRVVEIRDAILILRPYVDPDLAHQCTEVHETDTRERRHAILVQAAALGTALDAYRAGHRQPPDSTKPTEGHLKLGEHSDMLADARLLVDVAAALNHPFVRQTRHNRSALGEASDVARPR